MKTYASTLLLLALCAVNGRVWAHGFGLQVDDFDNPTSISEFSQSDYLDPNLITPAPMNNLFLEDFGSSSSSGYYSVNHGFAQTSGPFPDYSGATFNITSALYFSDGTLGANGQPLAAPAPNGTYVHIYDSDYNPITNKPLYPGATNGTTNVYGNTSFDPGFGVSLFDAHELTKELFLGSGSGYGEYGFSYTVTVPFTLSDGSHVTLTTGPLVDVFSMSDPNQGGFSDPTITPYTQQDAATYAIYRAIMRGDFNLDGQKTAADVPLMLRALADPSVFQVANNLSDMEFMAIADVNQDGVVSNADVQALLLLLQSGGGAAATVPEPSAALLAGAALASLMMWRRRTKLS